MTTRQIPAIRNVEPAVAKILEPMRAALLELTSGTTRAVRYTDLDRGSFQVVNNVLKPIVVPKVEPEITRRIEILEAVQTDISTLADELLGEARFGKLLASNLYDAKVIKANVNGHVAGLAVAVYDSGEHITSDFIVQADRFSVVFPSPPWAPNQGYAQGQYVTPTAEHGATGFIYECTTAGVSGATEPAWPAEEGQTVTDGTAVWTCRSIDERVPFVVGNIDGTPGVGIDGDLIVDGTILARHIKAQAITADKIAAGAIEAEHLATNLLLTSHIQIAAPGVIHSGQLAYDVGVGFWIGNDGVTPKLSIGNSGGNKITWDGFTLTVIGNVSGALDAGSIVGTLPSSLFDISALGWTIDATFSAVDGDTVAWTAGTLYTAAGASYAIEAGDTGDMTERTYIYFDVNVSTTALQVTTDPGSAVGPGRVMIAVAENDSPLAFFQVFGGSGSFGATVPDIPSYGPLANGDFETGSTDGWEADASWSVVSGSIVTGTHVARIATSTTGLRSLPFTAGQGQRFLVTCVAQRDETSLPDGNLRLELRWVSDPDTAPFFSSNVVEANASVSGPQFLRLVVEVPAGKVGAKVVARKITGSSGHWLVDDFFVTPMLRDADIGKINLSTQVDGILTAAFAEAGLINANVWINADGTLTGAGGGQAQLNALPGAIDLATQVSGLLTEQFAAAGLINENITINADGTLSGAGGGQVSISSLPGLLNLGTQVTGELQAAFAAAGLINANVQINADGTLSGAGGGQVQLPQLPGAISAGQIAANTITGAHIAALQITGAHIAGATISGDKIIGGSITGAHIAGASITGAHIAGGTITGAHIQGGTITGDKIAANTITGAKIAALTITAANIAGNTITASKLLIAGQGAALNRDPLMRDPGAWEDFGGNGGWEMTTVPDGKVGSGVIRSTGQSAHAWFIESDIYAFDPSKTYRLHAYVRRLSGNRDVFLVANFYNSSGTRIPGQSGLGWTGTGTSFYWALAGDTGGLLPADGVWRRFVYTFGPQGWAQAPATARFINLGAILNYQGVGVTDGVVQIQDLRVEEVLPGELVVDGAITASKIAGGAITGSHIAGATITGSHIAGSTITGSHIAAATITGNKIATQTITGDKIAAASITGNHIAANAITANHIQSGQITSGLLAASLVYAGNLQIATGGAIWSGQSTFDSGAGWFLGMPGGVPMFSIGNSAGNKITWNGSTLKIVGEVNFPGRFVALDDWAAEIGSNSTLRGSNDNNTDWVTAHQFTVFGTGTVTVRVSVSAVESVEVQAPQVRVLRNGTTVVGAPWDFDTGVGIEHAWTIPVSSVDDTFQVQLRSGVQLTPGHFNPGLLRWTSVRARLAHATFF